MMFDQLKRALSLLTVAPVTETSGRPTDSTHIAAWFPFVGLLTGAVLYLTAIALELVMPVRIDGEVTTIILMIASAGITRMMHWDGVADVADGLWGGYDPSRRREIASDTQIGSFGVTSLILYALASYVLISELLHHSLIWTLPMVWAISRFSATSGAWWGRPAKARGLGASISSKPNARSILIVIMTILISTVLSIATFASDTFGIGIAACLSLLIAASIPHLLSRPFGGITGDVLGCSIAISELVGMSVILIGAMI